MESTWCELVNRHQKQEGVAGLQKAIDDLLDESNGAFKLLLPDLTETHILYIGSDASETATNLSKSCRTLTALFVSGSSYQAQLEKNMLRKGRENLELLFLEQARLPFSNGAFDGVVIDNAIEDIDVLFSQNEPSSSKSDAGRMAFLREIQRVVKPGGWIFFKYRNRFSRENFFNLVKPRQPVKSGSVRLMPHLPVAPAKKRAPHSVAGYQRLLKQVGFDQQRVFGFDSLYQSIDRIIELNSMEQVRQFPRLGKLRYLPLWLYRLSIPIGGILAGVETIPASILDEVVKYAMKEVCADDEYQVVSIEINRKGKFVVILEINSHKPHRLVLKIPLTDNAEQHMLHNFSGLKSLHQALHAPGRKHNLPLAFPEPISSGQYKNIQYFVESCVPGRSFKKSTSEHRMASIVGQVENALIELRRIPFPDGALQANMALQQQISSIRQFVLQYKPSLLDKFDHVAAPVLRDEVEAKGPRYFFKSDFSVNNTLVEHGAVSGVIDFDFWGASHNKLVDYADFVFSFMRTFYGNSYADGLALINSSTLSSMAPFLRVEQTVKALGGDENEFKTASRIAWINSVCHILEFERTRLNTKRLDLILFNPIDKLYESDMAMEQPTSS